LDSAYKRPNPAGAGAETLKHGLVGVTARAMPPAAAAAARVDWEEGKVDDVDAVVGRESARVLWSGAGTGQHNSVGKRLFRFVSYMIALKYVRNLPYRRYVSSMRPDVSLWPCAFRVVRRHSSRISWGNTR